MKRIVICMLLVLVVLTGCSPTALEQPLITYTPSNITVPAPVITPAANPLIIITPNVTTTTQDPPPVGGGMITADEAIAIAKKFVPPQAVLRSKIEAVILSNGLPKWRVTFGGANVSRAELEKMGWWEGGFVRFAIQDPPGIYQNIIIDITGTDHIFMSATSTPITADEAIAIAKKFVPPQAILRSNIDVTLDLVSNTPNWHVTFGGANVSRAELEEMGWRQGPNVIFGVEIPPGTFKNILINVDAKTGDILLILANSGVKL